MIYPNTIIMINVGKAAELVAFVYGYHVQASSQKCAVLGVFCKGMWVGTILVTLNQAVAEIEGRLAKVPQVLPVTSCKATVTSFTSMLVFIASSIKTHFDVLQATSSPMAPPHWHTNETLLITSAIMLARDKHSPLPYSLKIKNGEWKIRFYNAPVISLYLLREKVKVIFNGQTKTFSLPVYTTLHLHRDNFFAGTNCAAMLLKWLVDTFTETQQC